MSGGGGGGQALLESARASSIRQLVVVQSIHGAIRKYFYTETRVSDSLNQ